MAPYIKEMERLIIFLLAAASCLQASSQTDSAYIETMQDDSLTPVDVGLPCWGYACPPAYWHQWVIADSGISWTIGCDDSLGLVNCQFINPAGQVMLDTQCLCIDRRFYCQKLGYLDEVPRFSRIIVSSSTPMLIHLEVNPEVRPFQQRSVVALVDTLCGPFAGHAPMDDTNPEIVDDDAWYIDLRTMYTNPVPIKWADIKDRSVPYKKIRR
jgi:hypothetical protein